MSSNSNHETLISLLARACDVSMKQVEGFVRIQGLMKEYELNGDVLKGCEKLEAILIDQGLSLQGIMSSRQQTTQETLEVVPSLPPTKQFEKLSTGCDSTTTAEKVTNSSSDRVSLKDKRVWVKDRWEYSGLITKGVAPCKFKNYCTRLECTYLHYRDENVCKHEPVDGRCPDAECFAIVLKRCIGGPQCKGKLCTYAH
jgi:hypothetical protein